MTSERDQIEGTLDLGPENEQQLAHLRRTLALGTGFQLVFLEVSHPEIASLVLQRLQQWSGTEGVPRLSFLLMEPGSDPVAALEAVEGAARGAVLLGLERPASGEAPGPTDAAGRSMATLNWRRDDLPRRVQGPLVLLLSPDGLRRLFVHAPDLVTWRAHTTRITKPRPGDLELRPWPSRRAALEEKAWLERMIDAGTSDARGSLVRSLPGWLIRLGEIEARLGGPWEQRFARAEELATDQRDLQFKLALARARRALEDGRHDEAERQEGKAAELISGSLDTAQEWESTRAAASRGAARREVGWVSHDVLFAELRVIRAERLLRTGDVEQATTVAEAALTSARASGDLALIIAALAVSGAIATHRGDRAEARSRFEEIRDVARVARDRDAELFALTRLLEIAPEAEHARALALAALELAEDPEPRALVYIALARQELAAGWLDEAERALAQIAPEAELPPAICGRILATRKELASARRRAAEQDAPRSSDPGLDLTSILPLPAPGTGNKLIEATAPALDADPEASALESKFIALDAPGDAPERLDLLDQLAQAYQRLGRRRDAGLCHVRAIWESPEPSAHERLAAWLAAELAPADTRGASEALDRCLAGSSPSNDDVRLVAAMAANASEAVVRDPHRARRWLDRFDDELDARTLWLARLGLSRIPGVNPRDLAYARDRILARLASGLRAEREQPTFLRRGRHGGALGLANGELLAQALEDLENRVATTRRKRSPFEAPVERTNAYATFQVGYGFARIGRYERARELAARATSSLEEAEVATDPVHKYLIGAFTARIEQAIARLPPETPLPERLRTERDSLDRVARYKIDRLREISQILEPVERMDAILTFRDHAIDSRGPEFARLRALADPSGRTSEISKLIDVANQDHGQRERLITGILDTLFELPEADAAHLLARTWPLIATIEIAHQAPLYADALVVAGHFGRVEMMPDLLDRLSVAIRTTSESDLARMLKQSLRALRRVGLHREIADLLSQIGPEAPRTSIETQLALASGLAFLGELRRAEPIFEQAREALRDERRSLRRLELIRAFAIAYSQTSLPIALRGLAELSTHLRETTDSFGTNTHFCLAVLHLVESIVLGLSSDDLILGETGRRFVEDDEYLIRRRLHRDLAARR